MILSAIRAKPLPIYGTGENIRDWLYVEDHVAALVRLLARGRPGETYLIGGGAEISNIDLVRQLCDVLDEMRPHVSGQPYRNFITFVADRPGHDFRYAIDSTKIRGELGWNPANDFAAGLRRTIEWYLENECWCQERLAGSEAGTRLGLGKHKPGDGAHEPAEAIRL
jgi:dTDP-glucose 4,6-dehydratase